MEHVDKHVLGNLVLVVARLPPFSCLSDMNI